MEYNITMEPNEYCPNNHYNDVVGFVRLVTSVLILHVMIYKVMCCCRGAVNRDLECDLKNCKMQLEDAEDRINSLEEQLEKAEELAESIQQRYDNCRVAAEEFLDTYPEDDEPSKKRKRME